MNTIFSLEEFCDAIKGQSIKEASLHREQSESSIVTSVILRTAKGHKYKLDVELASNKKLDERKGELCIAELKAKNEMYQKWIDDLQSGMYVNCVYCGHRYGPNPGTPTSMADVLKAHVETCPEHPMAKLKQEIKDIVQNVELSYPGTSAVTAICNIQKLLMTKDELKKIKQALRVMEKHCKCCSMCGGKSCDRCIAKDVCHEWEVRNILHELVKRST